MKKSVKIRPYTAEDASRYIDELARLRITVFRDFPYLYDGSMEYEKDYLRTYVDSPESIIVIAFDHDKVIGASTATPMEHETFNIKMPWLEKGYNINNIFYFGESVLLEAYRGMGIGVSFFHHRTQWAERLGRFDSLVFCAVIRPHDHPLKPANYSSLDRFWKNRGFKRLDGMVCKMSWKDIDKTTEDEKSLQCWIKKL